MSVEKVLVSVIGGIFQGISASRVLFVQFDEEKYSKFKILSLMSIFSIVSLLFVPNEFRFIYFLFFTIIALKFLLKRSKEESVLYSFNMMIIISLAEVIVSLLLVAFGLNSKGIVNNNFLNFVANILISIFTMLISFIPLVRTLLRKISDIFNKNKNLINYLYLFIVVIYIIILKNGLEFLLKSNYYINVLFIIGIVFILTIILKNESKYEQLKEENKQMLNYVTKYEKIITTQGKTNHEFKNQLMVIRGYAQMNSNKIIDYIDEIVEDSNKAGSSYLISQLNNFPDGGIKGLLYYKLSIMKDENIKYSINVEKGVKTKLKTLSINNYKNITKILGVLLDNAIDASKKSKHKKINISVIKDNKNIIFKIYNTYKGKIDIEKVGTGYISKGKGHGYGLRLVKDIINEDKLFNISHNLEDNYFVSSLYIKK